MHPTLPTPTGEQHSWTEALTQHERAARRLEGSADQWGVFQQCPYLYWWLYVKKMRPEPLSPIPEINSLYYEARARYAQLCLDNTSDDGELLVPPDELALGCREAAFDLLKRTAGAAPGTTAIVWRLFEAWLLRTGSGTTVDQSHSLYGVGTILKMTTPFPYTALIDLWHWDVDYGGPRIWRVRTSAHRSQDLVDSYRMDPKFLGQMYMWRKLMTRKWGPLRGYEVDLITRGKSPRHSHESVPVNWRVVGLWEKSMRSLYVELVQCQATGNWPRHMSWRCSRGRTACRLYGHCASAGRVTTGWRKKRRGEI